MARGAGTGSAGREVAGVIGRKDAVDDFIPSPTRRTCGTRRTGQYYWLVACNRGYSVQFHLARLLKIALRVVVIA